ncbi:hypothetical protein KIN20_026685 [Parelaphostrongylus tenuis]|uniref:Uncharacterized protein n=1 Tax=Parelaphostrongylus tenuis TaxID=148309 RepID=A0AAD5QYB5_PARTN|nr:hypothetical protein KIN20_026685 [Parelaphostrongylus tenuis]
MTRLLADSLAILVITVATVFGCVVLPPGQATTRNFTVTGFTLPVNMAYSTDNSVRTWLLALQQAGRCLIPSNGKAVVQAYRMH